MSNVKGKTSSASIDVDHVAILANIPISESEKKTFEGQLEETIKYIEKLQEIDTKNVKPTSQVTNLENITREDIAAPSFSQEEALQNAKSTYNGFVVTEAILEEQ